MKNIILNISCSILFIILFSACNENFFSTTLDDEVPNSEPQMAIHAFVTDGDSLLLASVSRTYGPLDFRPDNELLNEAEVEIYENGQLLSKLTNEDVGLRPLNFISILDRKIDGQSNTYEVVVKHPEFGEARASQKMPSNVPLTSAIFKERLGVGEDGDRLNGVTVTLDDPPGEDNYYEISVYRRSTGRDELRRQYIETNDPTLVESYEGWVTSGNAYLVDGTTFDGQTVNIDILGYSLDTTGQDLIVNWRCITEEMYRYSRTLYLVKDQAIEENPFASPVSVFSNIEGGLGVFGARTQQLFDVE